MASSTKRTRSERVASLKLEPSDLSRRIRTLLTGPALLRFALSLVTAVLLVVIFQGWKPPFAYREGQIPQRDVLARVEFEIVDRLAHEMDALPALLRYGRARMSLAPHSAKLHWLSRL